MEKLKNFTNKEIKNQVAERLIASETGILSSIIKKALEKMNIK